MLKIVVTEEGFQYGTEIKKVYEEWSRLYGSIYSVHVCDVSIIRNGVIIDTAQARTIGTHASFEGFEGFKNTHPSVYNDGIVHKYLQSGDIIVIDTDETNKAGISDYEYWCGMIGKTYWRPPNKGQ